MFIKLTPGGTRGSPKIQEVAPTDSRDAATTCMMWHFAPCGTLFWGLI